MWPARHREKQQVSTSTFSQIDTTQVCFWERQFREIIKTEDAIIFSPRFICVFFACSKGKTSKCCEISGLRKRWDGCSKCRSNALWCSALWAFPWAELLDFRRLYKPGKHFGELVLFLDINNDHFELSLSQWNQWIVSPSIYENPKINCSS